MIKVKLYKRENYLKKIRGFYGADDIIKVITRVHRCRKSSLMQTIAEEIVEQDVWKDNVVYNDLDRREYRKIKEADQLEILIDEVQNVKGFEEVLNGFRNEGEYSIFITGFNSYLLNRESITKLIGRYIEFEMFTLSFEEYESMKKFYNKTTSSNPLEELNSYILKGGFPRTLQMENLKDKRTYTQDVIKEIFEKAITRRIKMKDKDAFEVVRNFVINNFGSLVSINNIVRT